MTDILARLRVVQHSGVPYRSDMAYIMRDAADEIDSLRQQLSESLANEEMLRSLRHDAILAAKGGGV